MRSYRTIARQVALLVLVVGLAACAAPGSTPQPTLQPSALPVGGTNAEAGADSSSQVIIDEPATSAMVTSPAMLAGRLAAVPPEGGLTYRILDAENVLLASGTVATTGEVGGVGRFQTMLLYTALESGPGFLQLVQRNDLSGPAVAIASRTIMLVQNVTTPPTAVAMLPPDQVQPTTPDTNEPAPPLPTVQPQGQTIAISSPAAATTVGSPLTITGNTGRFPFQGLLNYRVVDSANRSLGTGSFPVSGAVDQPSSFVAELRFQLPAGGGPIRVDIYDQNASTGQVAAITAINLTVAAAPPTPGPQQITISSPPAGTTVGSPVVITGNTTQFPAQGNLKYRLLDQNGNQLGAGTIGVTGSAAGAASFNASLVFALPPVGGPLRLELADRDATTNQTLATAVLAMQVAPPATVVPQQQITISSPPGTQVGSPMTIIGSTLNPPGGGSLTYRVFTSTGQQIGTGTFPVNASAGQAASFTAQITFAPPASGGTLRIELSDRNPTTGNILASANLVVQVAAAPVVPSATPLPPVAERQNIRIASPAPDATVGSPLQVIGTTDSAPLDGNLAYTISDDAGNELGSGRFNVQGQNFNVALRFTPPAVGSVLRIELRDQDDANQNAVRSRTEVRLQYRLTAYPQ